MSGPRVLAVRLGAMGDVIHTLPAVATVKHNLPYSRITWVIEAKWAALLEGNSYLDRVILFERGTLAGVRACWSELRSERFDFAVDFQGLLKSALLATAARADRIYGFADPRERAASWFYSTRVRPHGTHAVDRNLDLAAAAGASSLLRSFALPEGRPEGALPEGDFVLANPLAGWGAKQWPLEYYAALGRMLLRETGLPLVLNGSREIAVENTLPHVSGLPGLLYATRRAVAVVGVDSGPLHLAAAVGRPGVAIFGPTDPARNGPYHSAMRLLRDPAARTSYRRAALPDPSMRAIRPEAVLEALLPQLAAKPAAPRHELV